MCRHGRSLLVSIYIYTYMYECTYVFIYVCLYVYIYVCIYVCKYVCMYVYLFYFIYGLLLAPLLYNSNTTSLLLSNYSYYSYCCNWLPSAFSSSIDMDLINFKNSLYCLFSKFLLLIGQSSVLFTAALSLSLSSFSLAQS